MDVIYELYPRYNLQTPKYIQEVLNTVAIKNELNFEKTNGNIKTFGGIQPTYTQTQLDRIYQSKDKHIQYFINQKIDFLNGEGLLIALPFTLKNIIFSIFRILKKRLAFVLKKNKNKEN